MPKLGLSEVFSNYNVSLLEQVYHR